MKFESQARVLKAIAEINENEEKHSTLIRSQTNLDKKSKSDQEIPGEEYGEPPVEGGPKTAEVVEDFTPSNKLLEEIDICKELSADQVKTLQQILVRNKEAFGLDGRLGNYSEEVEIPMLPNAKPIALPPIPLSPANREVVDKQIDSWLKLNVIEPSKSPWAAPVFIVWRKSKPRL
ncbi:hypothetical protein DFH05DRAFT_1400596, partial [Lentinula detonsa]